MAVFTFPDSMNDCIKYTGLTHDGRELPPEQKAEIFIQMPSEIPSDSRNYEWGDETDELTKTGISMSDINSARSAGLTGLKYGARRAAQASKDKGFYEGIAKVLGGEGENIKKAVNRRRGIAEKGHEEMFFNDVGRRSFEFSHEMLAKNEKETAIIQDIVSSFQRLAAPGQTANNLEFSHWTYPSSFNIAFYTVATNDPDFEDHLIVNEYLPKIGRCVLKDFNVDYFGEGYATFLNHAPVLVKISLVFDEVQKISKGSTDSSAKNWTDLYNQTMGLMKKTPKTVGSGAGKVVDWIKR